MMSVVFWLVLVAVEGTATVDYAWTEMGHNQQIVRVITRDKSCPDINIDGLIQPMKPRSDSPPPNFDIQVCECELPAGAQKVSVGDKTLPVVGKKPKRIAIIGDTGCRILNVPGYEILQNCNGAAGYGTPWPFPAIADAVAAGNPDLIIHLGDYHYRGFPCPQGNKGCAGPAGNNWPAWEADFFAPARNLLPKAPWVFVRGNHESCQRAWLGWFYLLAPGPLSTDPWQPEQCQLVSEPYAVSFDNLKLLVQDSANVPYEPGENGKTAALVAKYAETYNQLNAMASADSDNWFLSHEPIWGIQSATTAKGLLLLQLQLTLQAALKKAQGGAFSPHIGLLLSGHAHLFESFTFRDGRPPMMVVGNSGTKLSPAITPQALAQFKMLEALGVAPDDFTSEDRFGYAFADETPAGRRITLHHLDGTVSRRFLVTDKKLVPQPAK